MAANIPHLPSTEPPAILNPLLSVKLPHLSLNATDMSLMTLVNRTQLFGAFYLLTHEAHTSGPNRPLRAVEIACRLP
jgi:hypothetical protein